ncbi:carboxyl transferase domain-containing protein [uncultured Ferrimonas sp.]|uniref:acyl-CoA carboxylase subunit beta n=1 Tax=uncultured Ferrimonas sp. TaxID=432640 RepID=UPI00260ADC70|nr:carboxyl transferase domain-containing protein [uncultured Ferrimonas sp.]
MIPFQTQLDPHSDEYHSNRDAMLSKVAQLQQLRQRTLASSNRSAERFAKKNKLLPQERLSRLLDPGQPFLELHNMAGYLLDSSQAERSVPGASAISGIGYVGGVRCLVFVDDAGINAGAASTITAKKMSRAQDIALQQKLPFIHLVESAGANLMEYQVEMWLEGGAIFGKLAQLSAAGIPTIAILHGPSAAGGAYMPGMSDYVIGVKDNGKAYLAGPALLKAATGEEADDQQLGGAQMHATVSGLVEYLADNDSHAIGLCQELMGRLNWPTPPVNAQPKAAAGHPPLAPHYPAEEILGLVSDDYRKPYNCLELIARLVDGSQFLQFKAGYGAATVCVQARIHGMDCGIIANNGPIDADGACKAAQFIQLCDQAQTPLLFLQNITGYMVGTAMEQGGIIKHGAKMIQAVRNARVPRITLMVGASFGAGNYGMCGLGYQPDFLFSWPNAKIGVMGGESAAKTMSQLARDGAARKGVAIDEARLAAQEAQICAHFDKQSDAFYTSGRLLDDGIIDPRHSRDVIGLVLDVCQSAKQTQLQPNTFGIGRM